MSNMNKINVNHMNVLLVNPPRYKGLPVIREERCEIIEGSSVLTPYSLLQIGSLLKDKVEDIQLIDANGLNLSYEELKKKMANIDYDILIFKFTPTSFNRDIKTVKISKKIKPNAKTIGICYSLGFIANNVMEEIDELDIYIRHEYDAVIPNLIDNISNLSKVNGIAYREKNKIIVNKDAEPISNYDSLPIPAFHLLPSLKPYHINVNHGKPFTIMYASKGCPYNCIYCNVSRTKLKMKSVDRIIEEIDYLKENYDIKTISFFDETFTIDKKRVIEFCRKVKKYKIRWYCNTRTNLVTLPLLNMMSDSGCRAVSYGIESGSQKILDMASKGTTVKENSNAIKWAAMVGIKTHCSFIFGLPNETKGTINETLNFIKKTLPNSAEFNIATPYPGTKLYDYLIEKGLIKKDLSWHMLYQDTALFENKNFSKGYLEGVRRKAYLTLYLNPKWFLKNLFYLLKNPDDFVLASNFMLRVIKYYFKKFNTVRYKE